MQLSKSYFKLRRERLARLEAQSVACSAGCGNSIFRKENIKVKEIYSKKQVRGRRWVLKVDGDMQQDAVVVISDWKRVNESFGPKPASLNIWQNVNINFRKSLL